MAEIVNKAPKPEPDFFADVLRIASIAADYKAIDIRAYDVRGLTLVTDCVIVCSVASEPQFKAVLNGVRERMREEAGRKPLHVEGSTRGRWSVMDYGTVIFHIFREQAREFYDLDGLWGDAPQVHLELDDR